MSLFVRVKAVEPRDGLTVRVRFTNGEERDIDLTPYIGDGPIFRPLRNDPALFRAVTVEGAPWPGPTAPTSTRTCCISALVQMRRRRSGAPPATERPRRCDHDLRP
jgi:hypothetical protein